jgi:hypothetical protein
LLHPFHAVSAADFEHRLAKDGPDLAIPLCMHDVTDERSTLRRDDMSLRQAKAEQGEAV